MYKHRMKKREDISLQVNSKKNTGCDCIYLTHATRLQNTGYSYRYLCTSPCTSKAQACLSQYTHCRRHTRKASYTVNIYPCWWCFVPCRPTNSQHGLQQQFSTLPCPVHSPYVHRNVTNTLYQPRYCTSLRCTVARAYLRRARIAGILLL